ncbi:MAG TPA: ABC transporter permease [Verrucomicrobiae bacterium]|nr:ABC transporter permease [Verrucomicrobiae bacterium]
MSKETELKAKAVIEQSAGTALLSVGGTWRLTESFPQIEEVMPKEIGGDEIRVIPIDLIEWDSSLPLFLLRVRAWCNQHAAKMNIAGLPDSLKQLFQIILASEEQAASVQIRQTPSRSIGQAIRQAITKGRNSIQFIGECLIGMMELPKARRQYHWKAFFSGMVEAGPKALPIIGLLSFLVGLTFAYETSIQLRRFGLQFEMIGASGVSIFRQIGPLMAAILLAGRTGAAFAAHIANMKLGREIDALEVLGVTPVNFLALPRMIALLVTIPFTTLYSDLCGILGPMVIAVDKLDIPMAGFLNQLQHTVSITDIVVGLVKSLVFAVLIGLAGTLRGLQSERSSAGLGRAVTSAVVTGIAAILAADALFSPILEHLGF